MRNKNGIILVAFDLPTETAENRANYRKFRSYLIKKGFLMFQESVYFKMIRNTINSSKEIQEIAAHSPKDGNIIALPLTVNEVLKIRTISGKGIDTDELTEDVFFY